MAEKFKLKSIHRPVINKEWAKVFARALVTEVGEEEITLKDPNGVLAVPLVRQRHALQVPAYPAANPRLAQATIAALMQESFHKPLTEIPVQRLEVMPSRADNLVLATLEPIDVLEQENADASFLLERAGVNLNRNQRENFLYQICVGYTRSPLSHGEMGRLEEYLPPTVDLGPGIVQIVRAHEVDTRQR